MHVVNGCVWKFVMERRGERQATTGNCAAKTGRRLDGGAPMRSRSAMKVGV